MERSSLPFEPSLVAEDKSEFDDVDYEAFWEMKEKGELMKEEIYNEAPARRRRSYLLILRRDRWKS